MRSVKNEAVCLALAYAVFITAPVALQPVEGEGNVITSGSTNSCKNGGITYEKLLFHESGCKNAVITNNNTLAYMLNDEDDRPYSAVLTNRHLKNNELFEVTLERISNSKNENVYFLDMGVTNLTHADIKNINYIEPRDWMMQWHIPAEDENDTNFQKFIQFGIRLGVMRTDNGTLDIFVNGVNKRTINTKVSEPVYGVIEFLTGGVKATIMDSSATWCQQ